VPDLDVPAMVLTELDGGIYRIACHARPPGLAHVVLGALRSMADDYGALAFVDLAEPAPGASDDGAVVRTIDITIHSTSFAVGRSFDLSGVPA
jgi:hypothetical protein